MKIGNCLSRAAIVLAVFISGCIGVGNINSTDSGTTLSGKTSTLAFSPGNNYTVIEISRAINVSYTVAPECAVSVTLPEEYSSQLVVKVEKGTLKMTLKGSVNLGSDDTITAIVAGPMPKGIDISSAAGFYLERGAAATDSSLSIDAGSAAEVRIGTLVCGKLNIESSSASNISIANLTADRVAIDSSSASKVYIAGKCNKVDLESSSASTIDVSSLKATDGDVEASSGSSIKCSVVNLNKETSSGGSVSNE